MPSTGSTKVAAGLGTFALLLFLFAQPMAATPSQPRIRVLILDGFSNHDWQQTTALLRGILEASGCSQFRLRRLHPPPRLRDGNSGVRTLATTTWYWMTDLAVSQLTLSERNAAAARARVEVHLGKLARWHPQRIAAVRSELDQYEALAAKAVDEYTSDRRVVGNSLLAQARQHSLTVDELLAAIVAKLTDEAIAARERVVADAARATRLSHFVVAAAVLLGALLTLLLLRSIVVPLRRLGAAMDGLNAGNVDVPIPAAGADEIGAVARTLARFRDTLREQIRRERDLRAAHEELKATQAN